MLLILSGPFSIAILVGGCEHCLFCPYIGNNTTNWRTHIFQRSWKHQPVLCWITGWGMSSIIPSIVVVYIPIGFGFPKMGWMTKRPHHLLTILHVTFIIFHPGRCPPPLGRALRSRRPGLGPVSTMFTSWLGASAPYCWYLLVAWQIGWLHGGCWSC